MKDPNIKTKVVKSTSKLVWNVVGTKLAGKYKIAIVPYVPSPDFEVMEANKKEALAHAEFISWCFNHSEIIIRKMDF